MTASRPLTVRERTIFAPYFTHQVLDAARIVDGNFGGRVPFWLRRDMCAVVLNNHIYLRAGAYQPETAQGLALLGHELMHVAQYLTGMTVWRYIWSCRNGYRNSGYEQQAYALGKRVMIDAQKHLA